MKIVQIDFNCVHLYSEMIFSTATLFYQPSNNS